MKKFVDKHIRKAKYKYYKAYFNQHTNNSKKQWQMINSLINRSKTKMSKVTLQKGDISITAPDRVANEFNDYFCNIAAKLKMDKNDNPRQACSSNIDFTHYLYNANENCIELKNVTSTEVYDIIKNLKNKSTADTKILALKEANNNRKFQEIFAEILQCSLNEGVFPSQLKHAKVIPIHKGGAKTDMTNYRPISLHSQKFSKKYFM